MIGSVIEHYKIISILGEGGMGIVYKAFDLKLERYVALKILSREATTNPQFIARFKREAKNQAKLNHPNIVPVFGFTDDDNMHGIVMEYVEGETLEHMIQRKGKLEIKEALQILQQILTGAGYAHSKGFVHRDIKPSNIIINHEGVVKIMDFGISKSIHESKGITKTGTKIGTILYMSPEQIKALEPTNQSDIYSIGITFYEMLSGKTPFDSGTEFEIMEAHLKKNPAKLSGQIANISPEIDIIINKALNKLTAKRYQTCEEFLEDVNQLLLKLITTETKKKTIAEKKEKGNRQLFLKIRFYFYAFLFFCILGGLFYFAYITVSEFWKDSKKNKIYNSGLNSYEANQLLKSSWKTLPSSVSNSLNSIFFINDSTGFACGNQGAVISTMDGGKSWQTLSDSSGIDLYSIYFINSSKGFIVGSKGTILSTSNAGKSWQKINSVANESLFKIYFMSDKKTGFIVGANGTILRSNDEGANWYQLNSHTQEILYSINFVDNNNGFIVGWNGEILKTTDQGNNWVETKKFSDQYLRDINFFDSKTGIVVGGGGIIARTDNAGDSWKIISSNTVSGLYAVSFFDKTNGIILGGKGEILTSTDGGKNWKIIPSGSYASLLAITETPSKKIFIAGDNGTILTNSK
ncbi:MAG: protein kinase domain-containing protein [Ignavibacteriaceae bacterium]